jgi:Ca2+-binding EF-hand superfamily protein
MKILTTLVFALAITDASADLTESQSRFDANSDGRLDVEERQAMAALRQPGEAPAPDWKANSTKATVQASIDQRRADRFLSADSDGDRSLSISEFRAIPAVARLPLEKAAEIFSTLDHNRNAQISLGEFTAQLTKTKAKQNAALTVPAARAPSTPARDVSDRARTEGRTK